MMNKLKRLFKNPYKVFSVLATKGFFKNMSDQLYTRLIFRSQMGYKLNLKSPKTFNEKLQWLKLYDRRPEYTQMVDKYAVRKYIAETIGEEYLIPLLGVWDDPEDIDFNALPNQFVLKCNHNSGLGMCICKEKSTLDIEKVKNDLRKGLEQDYYLTGREWPYKDVPRKIIAEKYMEDSSSAELTDYKLMCFNGKVLCSFVCSDRFSSKGLHVTFFDREWNLLPFERSYPFCKEGFPKPKNYNEMIYIAEKLSQNIPFVRVDFYEINGKLYFGELTLYPGNGLESFSPLAWDYTLGDWLQLPIKSKQRGNQP